MTDPASPPATGPDPVFIRSHEFLGADHGRNERRVRTVIALTVVMMIVEITAGIAFGSMALVADGLHMSTHAAAMLIAAGAYFYARKHLGDTRFAFGTGKFGDLAGFASAIVLALVALFIAYESVLRLVEPVQISFGSAIGVAIIGLVVNLVSAWLLKDDHAHHHGHGHGHHHGRGHHHGHGAHHEDEHAHGHGGQDNNLKAAYLHVLADALTSLLAIVALAFGSLYGWIWLDPLMGIVGALVIAKWSWGLLRASGGVLVDYTPANEDMSGAIREAIETGSDEIVDLHSWQVGPGHRAAIVSILSDRPQPIATYHARLAHLPNLSHLTIEVADRGNVRTMADERMGPRDDH